ALLRRPSRPRVIARVPARRLLDAALDKARSAQPQKDARIEVVSSDLDVDVDGDPADLAEALCAVLDNALRVRAQNPGTNVQVLLRGNAAAVTFEVTDQARDSSEGASSDSPHVDDANVPSVDAPFLNPRADLDRPGLGVSLARARILVERNGGKLLTRSTADGSTVQLTMPRRMLKGAIGQA
ncbi:MAG TPA: ATP-binding protein, partial [Myxococcota bacterium]